MSKEINIATSTDLELAQCLNEYHGRFREAEAGLVQINNEINKRTQAALAAQANKEEE
jgi:hypothetical protein